MAGIFSGIELVPANFADIFWEIWTVSWYLWTNLDQSSKLDGISRAVHIDHTACILNSAGKCHRTWISCDHGPTIPLWGCFINESDQKLDKK